MVSLLIGVTYGAMAGYIGGWIDDIMMRLVDILYSIPFIFIVIFIITILSEDDDQDRARSWGIDRITIFYFVVGGNLLAHDVPRRARPGDLAARTSRSSRRRGPSAPGRSRIIAHHILPNLLSVVIVYLTLTIPRVMLFEAFLSFLGLGVEPPERVLGSAGQRGHQSDHARANLLVADRVSGGGAGRSRSTRSTSSATACATHSTPSWPRGE